MLAVAHEPNQIDLPNKQYLVELTRYTGAQLLLSLQIFRNTPPERTTDILDPLIKCSSSININMNKNNIDSEVYFSQTPRAMYVIYK